MSAPGGEWPGTPGYPAARRHVLMSRRRWSRLFLGGTAAVLLVPGLPGGPAPVPGAQRAGEACPPGYQLYRKTAGERAAERAAAPPGFGDLYQAVDAEPAAAMP